MAVAVAGVSSRLSNNGFIDDNDIKDQLDASLDTTVLITVSAALLSSKTTQFRLRQSSQDNGQGKSV